MVTLIAEGPPSKNNTTFMPSKDGVSPTEDVR
jgi:hypothetical protein